jgi:hypothetical protein
MTKRKCPTEHQEQCWLAEWLRRKKIPFFSVPNAQQSGPGRLGRLKKEGLLPGAPDLVLIQTQECEDMLCPSTGWAEGWYEHQHPVAVEMKTVNGKRSAAQREVHQTMRRSGWVVLVCYGFDDAKAQLEGLGF